MTSISSAGTTRFRLIGKSVDLRVTAHTIEIYYHGQSVAGHLRASGGRRFMTDGELRVLIEPSQVPCD
jgi:hypothetical protein